jgi:hypothetical protein
MTTKRLLLLLVILAVIGISAFVVIKDRQITPDEPQKTDERLKAEQEVYYVLFLYQAGTYTNEYVYGTVINQQQLIEYTNSGKLKGNTPDARKGGNVDFVRDEYPNLQYETQRDYEEINKISYPIKDFLPPTVDVTLVNPADGKQLYWWTSFSRIGFNSSFTQALVLVGDCRGELCYDRTAEFMYSQGFYLVLQKENGKWAVKDRIDSWFIEAPSP